MTTTAPIAVVDDELCPNCGEGEALHWVGSNLNVDYWDCFACTWEWVITVGT